MSNGNWRKREEYFQKTVRMGTSVDINGNDPMIKNTQEGCEMVNMKFRVVRYILFKNVLMAVTGSKSYTKWARALSQNHGSQTR